MGNRDDGGPPLHIELQDNGQGADHVAGDGLYAKYFMDFLAGEAGSKRYGLSCKVEGTNETKVNHGPNNTMREAGDLPPCCGSSAVGPDSDLQATGSFVRAQAGGLISVLPTTGVDLDSLYPPSRVSDLAVGSMDFTLSTFKVKFTWPGKQMDTGTVADFKVFYTTNSSLLQQPGYWVEEEGGDLLTLKINNDTIVGGAESHIPKESGEKETIIVKMNDFPKDSVIYWRLRAEATSKGADGKYSLSNIASVYLVNVNKPRESASLTWGAAIGIFFGAFAAGLLIGAAIFWHRRRYKGQ